MHNAQWFRRWVANASATANDAASGCASAQARRMRAAQRMLAIAAGVVLGACGGGSTAAPGRRIGAPPTHGAPHTADGAFTLSVVGTNDVHGALPRLPIFAGFVNNLRAARAAQKGAVMLIDAGDMFQGTLESNLREGADMIAAYNLLGYSAAAIGNHEFDFGPVGPAVTAQRPGEDPRGALLARAAEAKFPLLSANINEAATNTRVNWPHVPPSTVVTLMREGDLPPIRVGIIGVTTESTPYTTMPANFVGLKMVAPALALMERARELRRDGVNLVIATMHIGSACKDTHDANDLSSCESNEELFSVLKALPPGTLDIAIAGHTHAAMAHRIAGVAVIESYSSARAFGRIDVRFNRQGHMTALKIFEPKQMCAMGIGESPVSAAECQPGEYEGAPVVRDPAMQALVDDVMARTATARNASLHTTAKSVVWKAYVKESPLGNLFADLMKAAYPEADVALTNAGGLRANLPAGPLTYGALFEAMPFDNRFALLTLTGKHLKRLVRANVTRDGGIYSWAGLAARVECKNDQLAVSITINGKPLDEKKTYTVVTSDYLASGGDGAIGRLKLGKEATRHVDVLVRERMAELLKARGGEIDPHALYNAKAPRLALPMERPVRCVAPQAGPTAASDDADE